MDSNDPSQVFRARNVIKEQSFDDAAANIYGSPRRADDALIGLEFALAREPHSLAVLIVKEPQAIYFIKTRQSPVWPCVAIYYSCTDSHVTLLAIHRATPVDE